MKRSQLFRTLILAVTVMVGAVACKRPQKPITPIPQSGSRPTNPEMGGPVTPPGGTRNPGGDNAGTGRPVQDFQPPVSRPGIPTNPDGTTSLANREMFEGMVADREAFRNETVYFDFDRFAIKASEAGKLETIANQLKQSPANKLKIEGNCDERGTEEYNRSLGERRALSAREFLIKLGIAGDRITTVSFGEDKPADSGHDEAAWGKNRRDEFILLKP